MTRHNIILPLLFAMLFCLSCGKESEQNVYDSQETVIENFINARQAESESELRTVYNDGSARVVMAEGEGRELGENGTAVIYYAGYVLKGQGLSAADMFWTNHYETAAASGWAISDESAFEPASVDTGDSRLVTGLRNGLKGVKGGEECYILFSGKYGFGNSDVGTIPAKSALVFHVWVEEIL